MPTKSSTKKQEARKVLASLRVKVRSASGTTRMKEMQKLFDKLARLRADVSSVLGKLSTDQEFVDALTADEQEELRVNLNEMDAFLTDLQHQVKVAFEDMQGCHDNARIVSKILDRLDGHPHSSSKAYSMKRSPKAQQPAGPGDLQDWLKRLAEDTWQDDLKNLQP